MWLFTRLPRRPVRYRTVLRGAIFAAVGYEILKIVGTTYLASVTSNPTYGVFASAIGLLIWINLVSRFLLIAAAWTATGRQPARRGQRLRRSRRRRASPCRVDDKPASGVIGPAPAGTTTREAPRPAAVAGALVGTGALLGAGATATATPPPPPPPPRRLGLHRRHSRMGRRLGRGRRPAAGRPRGQARGPVRRAIPGGRT